MIPRSNGPDAVSHLWVAAAVLQLEVLQLQCRSSARDHFAELMWKGRGLPLTQKRKGCFAFKGGTSHNFLLSLIPLNLYFLKQELLPKNFVLWGGLTRAGIKLCLAKMQPSLILAKSEVLEVCWWHSDFSFPVLGHRDEVARAVSLCHGLRVGFPDVGAL